MTEKKIMFIYLNTGKVIYSSFCISILVFILSSFNFRKDLNN